MIGEWHLCYFPMSDYYQIAIGKSRETLTYHVCTPLSGFLLQCKIVSMFKPTKHKCQHGLSFYMKLKNNVQSSDIRYKLCVYPKINPAWLTPEIIDMIHMKNKLFKMAKTDNTLWKTYRNQKHLVNRTIKREQMK